MIEDYLKKLKAVMEKYSGMDINILTDRGNSAIKEALRIVSLVSPKKKILVPEDGGWLTYLKYPQKYGLEPVKIKCEDSAIDLADLTRLAEKSAAIMFSEPGGYFADQNIEQIYNICRESQCIVILDITGSIGRRTDYSKYCDILLASFGKWKPVNLGYGGFLGLKDFLIEEVGRYKSEMPKFDQHMIVKLLRNLESLPLRYGLFDSHCEKIKEDLARQNILRRGDKGIVVVVGFNEDKDKGTVISYCENNKYEYTICPRYIRVSKDAVCIEVKRLV